MKKVLVLNKVGSRAAHVFNRNQGIDAEVLLEDAIGNALVIINQAYLTTVLILQGGKGLATYFGAPILDLNTVPNFDLEHWLMMMTLGTVAK